MEAPKQISGRANEKISLLFVGADWERKGGPQVLEALEILRRDGVPAHLSIVGSKPLNEFTLPVYVKQYGFLDPSVCEERAKTNEFYRNAHAFLLPSHAECAGIVFAEAASHGLPIIARDVGGVSTMVTKDNGILIGKEDGPVEIANAIRAVVSDPVRYNAMSTASLRLFHSKLNWRISIEKVVELMQEAI